MLSCITTMKTYSSQAVRYKSKNNIKKEIDHVEQCLEYLPGF